MLFTPFTFPNGKTAKNRIFKSAMEEQLAQNDQPSEKLVRLYDTLFIMQINHAGKQSPAVVNKTPLAPSAVPLVGMDGFINPPRELSADEINGLIQQFVQTAKIAEQAGFSGVQIHAAHGYLISQFLSSHHNRRQDQ